jgi:hypothetical protein
MKAHAKINHTSCERSVRFERTARRYIPKGRTLHNHCNENLIYYILDLDLFPLSHSLSVSLSPSVSSIIKSILFEVTFESTYFPYVTNPWTFLIHVIVMLLLVRCSLILFHLALILRWSSKLLSSGDESPAPNLEDGRASPRSRRLT